MNSDMSVQGDKSSPVVIPTETPSQKVHGNKVADTLKAAAFKVSTVVLNLNNITTVVQKSPELYSGGLTALGGVGSIFSGNFYTGVVSTVMGGVTIYKALSDQSEGRGSKLENLIKDTSATLEIADTVNQKTEKKCKQVNEHLIVIASKSEELIEVLKDIEGIATEEFEGLNQQLDELKAKGKEAQELGKKATQELEASLFHNKTTLRFLEEAKHDNDKIVEDLKKDDKVEKHLKGYVKRLKGVQYDLTSASNSANSSSECVLKAMEFQTQMSDVYTEIQVGQANILNSLQSNFEKITTDTGKASLELAEIVKEKEGIAKHISSIKENCEIQHNLLNQCQINMTEAAKEINHLNVKLSLVIGALVGFTAITLGAGFPIVMVISLVGGLSYYFANYITGKVADGLFGPYEVDFKGKETDKDNLIVFAFNQRTGGLWARIFKTKSEPSKNEGVAKIRINDELELIFPFNLKDIDPISPRNAIEINEKLLESVKNKLLSPEACLKIIERLQTIPLGDASSISRKGFFTTAVLDSVKQEVGERISAKLETDKKDLQVKEARIKELEVALKTKEEEVTAKVDKQNKLREKMERIKKKG